MSIQNWTNYAEENKFNYLIIVKDLEDKDIFPVYCNSKLEVDKYCNNIVSESKLKVVEVISLADRD